MPVCVIIITVQPKPSNSLAQQTGLATSSSPGSDYGNGTQAPYSIIVRYMAIIIKSEKSA